MKVGVSLSTYIDTVANIYITHENCLAKRSVAGTSEESGDCVGGKTTGGTNLHVHQDVCRAQSERAYRQHVLWLPSQPCNVPTGKSI